MPQGSGYTEFNLKKLHGVFGFSVFTGFLVAIQISTGFDISETGISLMVLKAISGALGSPSPYLVPAITVIMTVADIAITLSYIHAIAEHKIFGIAVSGCGFFGSLSAILGSLSNHSTFLYLGVMLWIVGVIIASVRE